MIIQKLIIKRFSKGCINSIENVYPFRNHRIIISAQFNSYWIPIVIILFLNSSHHQRNITMKNCLPLIIGILSASLMNAQMIGLSVEVHANLEGMYESYDLTGYKTYRIYADMTSDTDFLSAQYGLLQEDESPDDQDLSLSSTGDCFEHPSGGLLAIDNNCALYPSMPALEYDSYFTIGISSSCGTGNVFAAATSPVNAFMNDACDLFVDDGAVFTLNGDPNGLAGGDSRVLIAQVTTNGAISYEGCFQIFVDGIQANIQEECFSIDNALGGCMDPLAMNYDGSATIEDGSCVFGVLGCTDTEACNYNPDAQTDDNTCTYPGCMDLLACNYNPDAGCEDNSLCTFVGLHSIEGSDDVLENALESYSYENTTGSTYNWEVNGGQVSSGQGSSEVMVEWTTIGQGSISIVETDATGCMSEGVEIFVTVNEIVGVSEASGVQINLYPNPIKDAFFVQIDGLANVAAVTITDMSGKVIHSKGAMTNGIHSLPAHELASGVYFVRIESANLITTKRIIVQH